MDAFTAAVLGVAIGGAIGLIAKAIGTWQTLARARIEADLEAAKLKSAWYAQMQQAKQKGKKKGDDDQDDDVGDDILLKAVRHPLVRGFFDGTDIDVDALQAGNRKEWGKLKNLGKEVQAQIQGGAFPGLKGGPAVKG